MRDDSIPALLREASARTRDEPAGCKDGLTIKDNARSKLPAHVLTAMSSPSGGLLVWKASPPRAPLSMSTSRVLPEIDLNVPWVAIGGLPIAAIDREQSARLMIEAAVARRGSGREPLLITSANGQVISMCA